MEKGKLTAEEYRCVLAFRRNLTREEFRFFGEGGQFNAKMTGVREVRWEPKFFLLEQHPLFRALAMVLAMGEKPGPEGNS